MKRTTLTALSVLLLLSFPSIKGSEVAAAGALAKALTAVSSVATAASAISAAPVVASVAKGIGRSLSATSPIDEKSFAERVTAAHDMVTPGKPQDLGWFCLDGMRYHREGHEEYYSGHVLEGTLANALPDPVDRNNKTRRALADMKKRALLEIGTVKDPISRIALLVKASNALNIELTKEEQTDIHDLFQGRLKMFKAVLPMLTKVKSKKKASKKAASSRTSSASYSDVASSSSDS